CMATDAHGNTNGCSFRIIIVDTEPPSITCPALVTNAADTGQCYGTGVALGTPTTSDDFAVASVTNDAPTQFPVGNTTVHWVVADTSGHSNTCSQIVTILDAEAPLIVCTNSVVTNADFGS